MKLAVILVILFHKTVVRNSLDNNLLNAHKKKKQYAVRKYFITVISRSITNYLSLPIEAVVHRCSSKSQFLKVLQYSHECSCVEACFSVNIAKLSYFIDHRWWLLLYRHPVSFLNYFWYFLRFLFISLIICSPLLFLSLFE